MFQYQFCSYFSTQILDVGEVSRYVLPQQNNVVDLPDDSSRMMQHLGFSRHQCAANVSDANEAENVASITECEATLVATMMVLISSGNVKEKHFCLMAV